MLTLASNERIPLKGHMRMIFEIRDLNFASPATVSRAGIIYISTNTGSQWRSLIKSWLLKLEAGDALKAVLRGLFDRYCERTLFFLKKECRPLVPVEDATAVTNLLRLLRSVFTAPLIRRLQDPAATPPADVERIVDTHFVFCALWAFGAALSKRDGEDYRHRFSEFWRGEFKTVRVGTRNSVFDFWLDPATLAFEEWTKSPHFFEVAFDSKTSTMASVTVPTSETCSVTHWMSLLVAQRSPVMLVGYAGCGKTQLVSGLLSSQKPEERVSHVINFNYFTDARTLQSNMEGPLEKKTGTNYGPPGNAALIYYLDDLNLPEVDNYNTQSAIALVREHFDYGHWYDRTKLQLRNISSAAARARARAPFFSPRPPAPRTPTRACMRARACILLTSPPPRLPRADCQYIASLNPTAGSFVINPRLQRHFFSLAVGFPRPESLHTIFEAFLKGHLVSFSEDVRNVAGDIRKSALTLHQAVSDGFKKSATNFHYEFNIRHISNVFQGLLQAQPAEFKTQEKLSQLWLHESERVYGDRLVSPEDLAKYRGLAQVAAKRNLPSINLTSFFGAKADPLVFW
jgi:dynein heavy chain